MRGFPFARFGQILGRCAVIAALGGALLLSSADPSLAWHGRGGHGDGWGWGLGLGLGLGLAPWAFAPGPDYYAYPYGYPYPYAYPPVTVAPAAPATVIQQAPPVVQAPAVAASYYYCDQPKGYYPYVGSCSVAWRQVPVTPPK